MLRSESINILYQQMLNQKKAENIYGAAITANKILEIRPRQKQIMEVVTEVLMNAGQLPQAHKAIDFIAGHFRPTPYFYVLKVQLAYTEADYQSVLDIASGEIETMELPDFYKAVLYNILAKVYLALGDAERGAAAFLKSSQLPDNPSRYWEYSNYLFALQHLNIPREELFSAIKNYANIFRGIKTYKHMNKYRHDKIRIGYISADFCNGVAAHFTYALFAEYDKERFELYAYNLGRTDNITANFQNKTTVWRDISNMAIADAAALIYADELDILVDLAGHTNHSGLPIMAYKPTPVQISGIGWMNSTGLHTIDYFLTDINVDPVGGNDEFFTEKLIRLPHSHFCYDPLVLGPPLKKKAPCVSNGYITFGSFNRFAKLTSETLAMWSTIMQVIPEARLILRSHNFDVPLAKERAMQKLGQAGVPIDRVQLKGFVVDYLSAYDEVDIALDTFPYPGGGTTCDALYAGVPVISLKGMSHNSRFGYSLLKNIGLEELCSDTAKDYVDTCIALSQNQELLNRLRYILRERMLRSPIMDKRLYMHDLENCYCQIVSSKKSG